MKITNFSATTKSFSRSAVHTLLITLFALVIAPAATAEKGGKGKGGGGGEDGGGDTTNPPPVTYSIQWITPPAGVGYTLLDINDNGWTSGQINTSEVPYSAVVFMPDGTPIDLNLMTPLPAEDGYFMAGGYSINNSGVVAGGAYNPLTDQWRSYRYIPAGLRDTVPVTELLPDTPRRLEMNNFGDVACLMPETATVRVFPLDSSQSPWDYFPNHVQGVRSLQDFNDLNELLYLGPWSEEGYAILSRYTPFTGETKTFDRYTTSHLNNHGTIAANFWPNSRTVTHVTYSDATGETVIASKAGGYPSDINDFGVVIGWTSERKPVNYVYFPQQGTWDVNELVADGGDAKWQSAEISLAAINNNGQIAGNADVVGDNGDIVSEGFILTPVAP